MIEIYNTIVTNYFLPEDGNVARAKFLELLSLPTELWMAAYSFTMDEAFSLIKNNADKGIANHLLLDYTQCNNEYTKPKIKEILPHITNGSLTLTTAGEPSKRKSAIWHYKAFVKTAEDGGEPWCWHGSINFSINGWFQGNSGCLFRSQQWADTFVEQQKKHEQWARENLPHYQPLPFDTNPVDFYFDSIL